MNHPCGQPFRPRRAVLVVSLLLGVTTCGPRTDTTAFTVTDSAGVSIALNAAGVDAPAWTLGDRPLAVIGDEAAGDAPLFRVYMVRLGSDGCVVVAHGGGNEIRAYAGDGAPLWVAGRAGQGPGEFRNPMRVDLLRGDSVAVLDGVNQRLTIFDAAGRFVDAHPLTAPRIDPTGNVLYIPHLAPLGTRGDHRVYALTRMLLFLEGAPGERTMDGVLSVFDTTGQAGDSIASVAISRQWESPGGKAPIQTIAFVPVVQPFAANGMLYTAETAAWDVSVYGTTGKLRSIREDRARVPVTQAMVDALPELPMGMERAPHVPDSLPAIGRVVADHRGRVWAVAYRPDDAEPTSVRIYDADGRLSGVLALPGGFDLMDVRDGRLVGVQKDAMEVETVVLYAVREGTG